MVRGLLPMAAGAFCVLAAAQGGASPCTDQIDALESRLNDMATAAGSASSGGQAVAAAREGQAMEARNENRPVTPPPAAPFQAEGREVQATQRAADAGGGGDRVMQAKATLNQARTLDSQGNATGCMEAVGEARRQLGN